ncbi:MAG: hypothetical protein HC904_07820 [Blastochloris sp.]|nr:hypothetical protein [Blastochloris sp.]
MKPDYYAIPDYPEEGYLNDREVQTFLTNRSQCGGRVIGFIISCLYCHLLHRNRCRIYGVPLACYCSHSAWVFTASFHFDLFTHAQVQLLTLQENDGESLASD